jgi:Transglycosylase-like domain
VVLSVFKRRIPATIAVVLGVAFPAAAIAANGQESEAGPRAAEGKVGMLERPARRLRRSIEFHVEAIRREQRRSVPAVPAGVSMATLDAIAACESGGDPTAVSADGTYRGKYQFDYGTWAAVGGSGDPAAAPEAEQDYRAALLYAQSGSSPWPVCGV